MMFVQLKEPMSGFVQLTFAFVACVKSNGFSVSPAPLSLS